MVEISPFKALRPVGEKVSLVNSPPYDVVSREKAVEIIKRNPCSFLRVIKPEALVSGEEVLSQRNGTEIAARNLTNMIEQGVMKTDSKPCFYIYQQINGFYCRTGIVACLTVDDYEKGIIKQHEKIRLRAWQGRVEHIYNVRAHTGCVFTVYKSNFRVGEILQNSMTVENKIYDFISEEDEVKNKCWKIDKEDTIKSLKNAFKEIPFVYIADGHHRAAAAAEVAKRLRKEKEEIPALKKGEYSYFPAVLLPHDQIQILGYHRLIKKLTGFSANLFLDKLKEIFQVKNISMNKPFLPGKKHEFGMNLKGQWYKLFFKLNKENKIDRTIIDDLDVSILQDYVLGPLLGINDPQKNKNIEFIGGTDSLKQLSQKIDQGADIAFTLFPTSIKEVLQVSDEGKIMPPKSTWFEPKIRSGIFVHQF